MKDIENNKENNKEKRKKRIKTGGVAIANGIIFTSNIKQVIVERVGDRIKGREIPLKEDKSLIYHIPILRGILGIGNQLNMSSAKFTASLNYLNNTDINITKNDNEKDKNKRKERIKKSNSSNIKITTMYIIILFFAILIPVLISAFFQKKYQTLVQVLSIVIETITYFLIIKNTKELDNIFMYHGAEHKAVNTYEKYGDIDKVTIENTKKESRIHKRCGGNLVLCIILLTILSAFIPVDNIVLKACIMLILGILNIGIAYEIILLLSIIPRPFDVICYPLCLIQLVTTKEPTDEMLELARIGVIASVSKKDKTILEIVNEIKKEYDIDTDDIYRLIESIMYRDINDIKIHKDTYTLNLSAELDLKYNVKRYIKDEYPLQYITHKAYFFNEEYYVDENVLIPRQDTEILVEKAIEYIEKENITKVIDLCTGSGVIGISIARNTKKENIDVELIDISHGALSVAKRNIERNRVEDRVHTLYSDLLKEKIEKNEKVDMVVSNPPYIKSSDILNLDKRVQKEPRLALDGGIDGIDYYIKIIDEAKKVLNDNGLVLFEIGYDELEQIRGLIYNNSEFKIIEEIKDYGGNDRVVVCRFQQI